MKNFHALLAWTCTLPLLACRGEEPGELRGGLAPADVAAPREGPSGKELPREPDPRFVRVVWHDGDAERELWLDPLLLADHRPAEPRSPAARAALGGARALTPPDAQVRIDRLDPEGPGAQRLAAELAAAGELERWSPVLRTAPSERGALRSLPGGVVVTFDARWTEGEAEAWLAGRGLAITRRLALGRPAFVVASPAGLAALELAEELHALEQTSSAQPDWWAPVAPK